MTSRIEPSAYFSQIPDEWKGKYENEYRAAVLDPATWLASGDKLAAAAKLLRPALERHWEAVLKNFKTKQWEMPPSAEVADAYYMLLGLAGENYAKAVFVKARRAEVEAKLCKDNELLAELGNHITLERLQDWTGLKLEESDEFLVKALALRVEWSGRYPIPKRLNRTDVASGIHGKSWVSQAPELVARLRAAASS